MMSSGLLLAFLLTAANAPGKVLAPVDLRGARREPVAAAFLRDDLAAIACAKSGTLILWDVKNARIKREYQVGQQLRSVASIGDDELLVIDDKAHELIQLHWAENELSILDRQPVPEYPVALRAFTNEGQQQVAIASLWSREVSIWSRTTRPTGGAVQKFRLSKAAELPFEPRWVLPIALAGPSAAQMNLLVADAFGGSLAFAHGSEGAWKMIHTKLHNFGDLCWDVDAKHIWLTQLTLNPRPITRRSLVDGQVMGSHFSMLDSTNPTFFRDGQSSHGHPPQRSAALREIGGASGDPAGLVPMRGQLLICLAGVNEVVVMSDEGEERKRLPVGKRPRTIATRGDRALVLGELDDSVTVIDLTDSAEPVATTTVLDPATADRKLTPAERGERLFFDARMSDGGVMSCHSCHTDGHTNGLLADTLGDNTHGTPKRVLTLRGTRMTDLWAWNGEMKTLQDNVHKSLQDTMHAPKIEPRDVDDLVSFLHTLPPVPPLKPKPKDDADAIHVARGERIFAREGCTTCHVPPLTFTSHAAYDVGMPDEQGLKKFNPPSLRGVGRLRRLFHDNRAASLKDVFETYGHQLKEPLPAAELADLVRYLESL